MRVVAQRLLAEVEWFNTAIARPQCAVGRAAREPGGVALPAEHGGFGRDAEPRRCGAVRLPENPIDRAVGHADAEQAAIVGDVEHAAGGAGLLQHEGVRQQRVDGGVASTQPERVPLLGCQRPVVADEAELRGALRRPVGNGVDAGDGGIRDRIAQNALVGRRVADEGAVVADRDGVGAVEAAFLPRLDLVGGVGVDGERHGIGPVADPGDEDAARARAVGDRVTRTDDLHRAGRGVAELGTGGVEVDRADRVDVDELLVVLREQEGVLGVLGQGARVPHRLDRVEFAEFGVHAGVTVAVAALQRPDRGVVNRGLLHVEAGRDDGRANEHCPDHTDGDALEHGPGHAATPGAAHGRTPACIRSAPALP